MLLTEEKISTIDHTISSESETCSAPIPSSVIKRFTPMEWWRDKLKSPRFVLAPMVDASELAWRLLARRHGADLTYSPMFHACLFAKDPIYRERAMQTCKEDKPFIVQFCSNDPEQFVEAGLLVQGHCDAVDLNLGCPQAIARRGRYGAFLQDDWELIERMVSQASKTLSVPVTCKVRVFEDIERTVNYAKMLENAGAFALTVHGRTREQKGPATGKANWDHIKAVRSSVQVPVIANGNIECAEDVYNCFKETGCHAVMTAEGSLHNPAVFHTSALTDSLPLVNNLQIVKRRDISLYQATAEQIRSGLICEDKSKRVLPENWQLGQPPPVWEPGLEYLEYVSKYPCPFSYIRGHLFKLFHHCLSMPVNYDLRTNLAKSSTLEEFKKVVMDLRHRFLPYHEGREAERNGDDKCIEIDNPDEESRSSPWPWHPPWLCQPYIRPTLAEQSQRIESRKMNASSEPRKEQTSLDDADAMTSGNVCSGANLEKSSGEIMLPMKRPHPPDVEYKGEGRGFGILSKRKLRQLQKRAKGSGGGSRAGLPRCALCLNPMGLKCAFKLCRSCCKIKCNNDILDCVAHRFMVKTKKIRHQKKGDADEGKNTIMRNKENPEEGSVPCIVSDEVDSDVNTSESLNCNKFLNLQPTNESTAKS